MMRSTNPRITNSVLSVTNCSILNFIVSANPTCRSVIDSLFSSGVFIAFTIAIGIAIAIIVYRNRAFKRSWKSDTLEQLARLEENLSEATVRESAMALSEYIRRIAVHRFSRNECAGLVGVSWLQWLTKNDPKRFDWKTKGRPLIEAPYAPPTLTLRTGQVKDLIQAARGWVR